VVYGINQFMQDATAPSTANAELPVDHERLKYVTGLLGTQEQGLNTALFGTFLFLMEAPLNWPRGWPFGLAWLAGMLIFFAAWRSWIPKYYRYRFGRVEPQEISAKGFGILLLVLIALMLFGRPVARGLEPLASSFLGRLHLLISDPSHQINLWASSFWMASLFASLLWRRRIVGRWFCFLGLLASLSVALFPIWHPAAERLEIWKVLNGGGVGLSFIAIGLYEHIVLVRALPTRVAEGDDE
jgi:hypothetical protein